jgi:Protein of unknown function (DUF4244)
MMSGQTILRTVLGRRRSRICRVQQRPRLLWSFFANDAGMSTAEYAIGTVAAAAFASLLYSVITGGSVTGALTSLIQRALESSL